jgi:Fe-S-cluster containining protein
MIVRRRYFMAAAMNLCGRCAKRARTCCQHTDIYVTSDDIQRICGFTGFESFTEYRRSSNPGYDDQADDPIWGGRVFRPDGSRRVLKQDAVGNCMFLSSCGCILPLEVRPLICRLHPHLYNFQGLYAGVSPDCPLELLEPGERLEEVIPGFDIDDALRWHRMLYNEIEQEGS